MTRAEAIQKAAELQVALIQKEGGNASIKTWKSYFKTFPMRSKKFPMFSLMGFMEGTEPEVYPQEHLARPFIEKRKR